MALVNITGGTTTFQMAALPADVLTIGKANPIYVNQAGDTMEGDLDMKKNKITNVLEPVDRNEVSNKSYVDKSEERMRQYVNNGIKSFARATSETLKQIEAKVKTDVDQKLITMKEPISKESVRYVEYDYILKALKPKFWFTSFLPEVFNIGMRDTSFVSSQVPQHQNTPFIKFTSNDYVISEFEFGLEYAFIGVVRRITQGRVFTSLTGNKFFGFWKNNMNVVWHDGPIHMNEVVSNESIHFFIYTVKNNKHKLTDDSTVIFEKDIVTKPWDNLVIGDTMFQEGAEFELYDCLGFDRKLTNKELIKLRTLIKQY